MRENPEQFCRNSRQFLHTDHATDSITDEVVTCMGGMDPFVGIQIPVSGIRDQRRQWACWQPWNILCQCVAAQAVVSDGKVQGMAPNASIISVANYYNGGLAYDAWRFVAEGPDGIIDSGDGAQTGSFSFGYSSTIDAGSEYR